MCPLLVPTLTHMQVYILQEHHSRMCALIVRMSNVHVCVYSEEDVLSVSTISTYMTCMYVTFTTEPDVLSTALT